MRSFSWAMFLISITGSDVTRKKKLEEMGQGFCIKTIICTHCCARCTSFSWRAELCVLISVIRCFHHIIIVSISSLSLGNIYISELHHSRFFSLKLKHIFVLTWVKYSIVYRQYSSLQVVGITVIFAVCCRWFI